MMRAFWTSLVHAFRRTALPLAAYYAITLVLPLANGAARSGSFAWHALVVLVVPPIVIGLACGVSALKSYCVASAFRRKDVAAAEICTQFEHRTHPSG